MAAAAFAPTPSALPTYDLIARKAHQWAMVELIAAGFLLGSPAGAVPVAIAGAIMLIGRFWWPADVVRQVVWRVLEPAGFLPRLEAHEDRATRRLARTLGGIVWLLSGALLLAGPSLLGWIVAGAIAAMVVLDASVDFCVLCFAFHQLERRRLLPAQLAHQPERACLGER